MEGPQQLQTVELIGSCCPATGWSLSLVWTTHTIVWDHRMDQAVHPIANHTVSLHCVNGALHCHLQSRSFKSSAITKFWVWHAHSTLTALSQHYHSTLIALSQHSHSTIIVLCLMYGHTWDEVSSMRTSLFTWMERHCDVEALSHRAIAGVEAQVRVWWAQDDHLCFVSVISTVPAMDKKIHKNSDK